MRSSDKQYLSGISTQSGTNWPSGYHPASHVQVPPAAEVWPAPHVTQSAEASLPAGDDLPALQFLHVVSPEAAYLPAPHVTQLPPAAEVLPASQFTQVPPAAEVLPAPQSSQSPASSLPARDDLPATQSVQSPSVELPTTVEYLPAPQSVHVLASVAANLPAAHWAQAAPAAAASPAPQSLHSPTESLSAGDDLPAPQSVHVLAEAPEYLPSGHCSHKVFPVKFWYFPASQFLHVD